MSLENEPGIISYTGYSLPKAGKFSHTLLFSTLVGAFTSLSYDV